MSDKPAAARSSTLSGRNAIPSAIGDSLRQSFMHDQLEALLASPTLARVAHRHSDDDGDEEMAVDPGESEVRTTDSDIDPEALRDALRMGLGK